MYHFKTNLTEVIQIQFVANLPEVIPINSKPGISLYTVDHTHKEEENKNPLNPIDHNWVIRYPSVKELMAGLLISGGVSLSLGIGLMFTDYRYTGVASAVVGDFLLTGAGILYTDYNP